MQEFSPDRKRLSVDTKKLEDSDDDLCALILGFNICLLKNSDRASFASLVKEFVYKQGCWQSRTYSKQQARPNFPFFTQTSRTTAQPPKKYKFHQENISWSLLKNWKDDSPVFGFPLFPHCANVYEMIWRAWVFAMPTGVCMLTDMHVFLLISRTKQFHDTARWFRIWDAETLTSTGLKCVVRITDTLPRGPIKHRFQQSYLTFSLHRKSFFRHNVK